MENKVETPRRKLRNLHMENVQSFSTPIRVPPSPMLKRLGLGTGVSVYRLDRSPRQGQMRSPWAVKRILKNTKANKDEQFNELISREADILKKLEHPNIVGYRGLIKSPEGMNTLALEMCSTSLGSILEERHDEHLGPLPAKHTFKMIMDIAHALDFLHTKANWLHGDIKSFNVLVKGEFEICKLCDFGSSLPLDENGEVNFSENPQLSYVGTGLWSAPEVIDEMEVIDTKADIFSFGMVIYETLALVPPHMLSYDTATDDEEQHGEDSKENNLEISLEDLECAYGTRPPLPVAFQLSDEYNCIVELFYLCTNAQSEDRPAARTIWQCCENNAANVSEASSE